jgi:hypothetical protein
MVSVVMRVTKSKAQTMGKEKTCQTLLQQKYYEHEEGVKIAKMNGMRLGSYSKTPHNSFTKRIQ